MTQLHRVLYCSRNCIPGEPEAIDADIVSILAASRENNARSGLTGALLFSQGCFAQVLEGPLDAVECAFERIQCDERHRDVTVLQSGPIEAREFPDWSMAYAGGDAAYGPLAACMLADTQVARSNASDGVLDVLRRVVARETDWLGAP